MYAKRSGSNLGWFLLLTFNRKRSLSREINHFNDDYNLSVKLLTNCFSVKNSNDKKLLSILFRKFISGPSAPNPDTPAPPGFRSPPKDLEVVFEDEV